MGEAHPQAVAEWLREAEQLTLEDPVDRFLESIQTGRRDDPHRLTPGLPTDSAVPPGLMTAQEAATYLRTTYRGLDNWVRRHGVKCERYGRKRLFRRDVLDRTLKMMAL